MKDKIVKPLKFTNVYREQSYLADCVCMPLFWVVLAAAYSLLAYLVRIWVMLTHRLLTLDQTLLDFAPALPFSAFHIVVVLCLVMSIVAAYVGSYRALYRRVFIAVAIFSLIVYSLGVLGMRLFIESVFQ